jgi:phosphohistidine phosphatase
MKTLYIIRHAKSSWKYAELADIDRPLKKRGKRDANLMGTFLLEKNIVPDIILTSPAKRAKQTAQKIANCIHAPDERIFVKQSLYYGGMPDIIRTIQNIQDSFGHAFLFGHNPEFTELAHYLSHFHSDKIPTLGIVCLEFDTESWKDVKRNTGTVLFFEYPKKFK